MNKRKSSFSRTSRIEIERLELGGKEQCVSGVHYMLVCRCATATDFINSFHNFLLFLFLRSRFVHLFLL